MRADARLDADHGDCAAGFLRDRVLLFGAPNQLPSLAGLEHGRTIPFPFRCLRQLCIMTMDRKLGVAKELHQAYGVDHVSCMYIVVSIALSRSIQISA
jgi:hypothetical protein